MRRRCDFPSRLFSRFGSPTPNPGLIYIFLHVNPGRGGRSRFASGTSLRSCAASLSVPRGYISLSRSRVSVSELVLIEGLSFPEVSCVIRQGSIDVFLKRATVSPRRSRASSPRQRACSVTKFQVGDFRQTDVPSLGRRPDRATHVLHGVVSRANNPDEGGGKRRLFGRLRVRFATPTVGVASVFFALISEARVDTIGRGTRFWRTTRRRSPSTRLWRRFRNRARTGVPVARF